jgi:anti-sigma B factor antagonist
MIETPQDHSPFRCSVSYVDDTAVVLPRGEVDVATAPVVLRATRSLLALSVERIVVDLRHVPFMDSSGLHALITSLREAASHGTEFVLTSVPPQPRAVMEITGLANAFGLLPQANGAPPRMTGGAAAD